MTEDELKLALDELYAKPQFESTQTGKVVFYGSSSFRLWADVKKDLGSNDIINLAFGGSTLAICADKFEEIVVPFRPRSIVIYAGDNDIGDGIKEDELFNRFNRLLSQIRNSIGEIPIVFLSIKPSIQRMEQLSTIRAFNKKVEEFSTNNNNCHYVDIHEAMKLSDNTVNKTLFEEDGLHLNRKGYALWTQILRAYSEQIFN